MVKKQINIDIPRFQSNPKGPDGYKHEAEIFKQPLIHYATVCGFNIQLAFSDSGRDWHMRVVVPGHFDHPNLDVRDHVSLCGPGIRDLLQAER